MMDGVRVFVGLGSNSVDKYRQIENAIDFLRQNLDEVEVSSIYETDALNGIDRPYVNSVVTGLTRLDESCLVDCLKKWERESGRCQARNEAGDIPIDMDLVVRGESVLRQKHFEREYFMKGYRELAER